MSYELSINYEGNDYKVQVEEIETANLILNDPQAAFSFLSACYPHLLPGGSGSNKNSTIEKDCDTSGSKARSVETLQTSTASVASSDDNIWIRKKPTERDLEATSLLLSLRQDMDREFNDKKTSKAKLWQRIATVLADRNYVIGDNAAERCRQKFANLTKSYLNFIKHQTSTGEGNTMDVPPFFEELHSILGSKHKVNPTHLEDSMQEENEQPASRSGISEDVEANQSEDSSVTIADRFTKSRKRVRPLAKSEAVLEELRESKRSRIKEFEFIQQHLKKTEQQRDRFLDILEKAFSKKRKLDEFSDSD